MDFEMYSRCMCKGTEGVWRLVWDLMCNHRYMPRKVALSGRPKLVSQVLKNATPSIVQLELSKNSAWGYPLPFEELGFLFVFTFAKGYTVVFSSGSSLCLY